MSEYTGFRITSLWAFTQVGDDDEEGIIAFPSGGMWIPMIASDRVRTDELRALAEKMAKRTGRPVKLSRFDVRTDLEEISHRDTV